MAAPVATTSLAVRGSNGISLVSGVPNPCPEPSFQDVGSRACKVMCYSDDGTLFGYCDGTSVSVHTAVDYRLVLRVDRPRTADIAFSPKNNFLITWEPYTVTKDNPQGSPNLNIWEVKTGNHIRGLFQKRHAGWCPQWTLNEQVCGRNVNNEIQFYEENEFGTPVHKLHLQKVADFSIADKCAEPYNVAAHVPGSKGQPSFVRIFRYPNFGGPTTALANKSFYNADRVQLLWNNKGNGLLVMTMTDTSADSYYGDQGLHFITPDGQSCLVPRGKNGPVYSVEWNPNSNEFCVVYGFMPAKATVYNLKCEPVFDFGTGPRNIAYYNPQGTVICLAGFGNLGGNMEFWNVKGKSKIAQVSARDSTFFEWCPDGKHAVTATTAPRLRVGNGYKMWDLQGNQLHEQTYPEGGELWEVRWRNCLPGSHPPPQLPAATVAAAVQRQQDAAKPGAYVPPAMRNQPQAPASKPKYREEYEPASNVKQQQQAQENMSKTALKNKKKREAKARAKEQTPSTQKAEDLSSPEVPPAAVAKPPAAMAATGDVEVDKQIRNLSKKLKAIQQLKDQQASGKELELNQLKKIEMEAALLEELSQLQLL